MSTSYQAKKDYMNYAENTEEYNKFEFKPAGILESQLVKSAIGDASRLLVLDLGGGAGVHAREAVDAGASRIDRVDITPTMLQVAKKMLEGVWKNIKKYLEPGGRFLGTRVADAKSHCLQVGKYGHIYKNFRPIPGGLAYTVSFPGDPIWEYEAASMEVSMSGSFELERKYSFTDIEIIPFESAETIQKDPEFWKLFLEARVLLY